MNHLAKTNSQRANNIETKKHINGLNSHHLIAKLVSIIMKTSSASKSFYNALYERGLDSLLLMIPVVLIAMFL